MVNKEENENATVEVEETEVVENNVIEEVLDAIHGKEKVEVLGSEEVVELDEQELSELEQLQVILKEEEAKYFRLLADYDNFKRRASLDQEALKKYRAQSVITNLIPVLDNFSRALAVDVKSEETQTMLEGMEMVYRTLVTALETEGLTEIKALDEEFDPNFHQAIMTDNNPDKPSGIVLEDLQKGYILKDRVLRPSMVKVND